MISDTQNQNSSQEIANDSITFECPADGQHSALELLHQTTQLSKSHLKTLAEKGAIWISQNHTKNANRLRRLKKTPKENETLFCYVNERVQNAETPPAEKIADFSEYSVWYKPKGMLSQGSKFGDFSSLPRWVEVHTQKPSWQIHRLDRATDGLMLIAHSKKCASLLIQLFAEKKIQKTYHAVVNGITPTTPFSSTQDIDGKQAISHLTTIKSTTADENAMSLVEVKIETGRKHQIRIHLSECGFPIIGDRLHGKQEINQTFANADLQLTAVSLEFICPMTQEHRTITLPNELNTLLLKSG